LVEPPTYTRPHPAYLAAMEGAVPALTAAGIEHQTVFEVGSPYISAARATMLRKALDAKADVIVFIDHDVSFRPDDLVSLIQAEGDVVAGFYRFKSEAETYMGTIHTDLFGAPVVRGDGALKGRLAPAGFLKITKEAVDRIMRAHPELCYGPRYALSLDLFHHGAHDGVWWGEDYAFCRRWEAMGEALWVLPDLDLTHHGADGTAYPGNFHTYLRRQPGGDLAEAA
jgi:glycosyltransferase involved in cell wall biosynthesis